jgi:aryl-alcohol dehydrogenase-like predicted oxidoreductase
MLDSRVPRVFVGTERMGSVFPDALASKRAREETFRFLDAVFEAGCTAFDLAASYQLGGTERLFGHWMRSRGNRDRLFLSGKGAHPYPVVRPNRLTPRDLAADLEDSLRRLGTDRLDQYLVHRDSPGVPLEPIAEALAGFVRAGKIGAYGVSNWTHARIAELDRIAESQGLSRPFVSSPQFSLVTWNTPQFGGTVSISGDAEARAFYTNRKLPTLAWSPLGRGFFAKAARRGVYDNPENDAKLARATALAERKGATPAQIALAWLFHQPFPVYAVVASRSVEHMKQNLEATRIALSPAEVRWLETGEGSPDAGGGGAG